MNKPVTDLSNYTTGSYNPGAGRLKRSVWYLTNMLFFLNPLFTFYGLKRGLLRLFGAKVGKGVVIKPRVNIKYPWNLEIGDFTWIGEQAWIDNLGKVNIGANVCLSQGALLLCGNHNYKRSSFDLLVEKITLEDGAWVGAGSIVGPGVVIGSHAVLSAGSVAGGPLDAYKIYRGNPAVVVRTREISD